MDEATRKALIYTVLKAMKDEILEPLGRFMDALVLSLMKSEAVSADYFDLRLRETLESVPKDKKDAMGWQQLRRWVDLFEAVRSGEIQMTPDQAAPPESDSSNPPDASRKPSWPDWLKGVYDGGVDNKNNH